MIITVFRTFNNIIKKSKSFVKYNRNKNNRIKYELIITGNIAKHSAFRHGVVASGILTCVYLPSTHILPLLVRVMIWLHIKYVPNLSFNKSLLKFYEDFVQRGQEQGMESNERKIGNFWMIKGRWLSLKFQ